MASNENAIDEKKWEKRLCVAGGHGCGVTLDGSQIS
jgi:hypothetical protein